VTEIANSPASSGPAGPHFEGQVGAFYLLSMLTGSEPRGLPGTLIDRVELQRAAEGRWLDDVIVHSHDMRGYPAVLEIQVKRTITFSPSDTVFRKVVGQIVKASEREDFWTSRYELAIATARTSRKINGAYQDVLTWARQLGDAETFFSRINRPGSANPDMRTFVQTFKAHLRDEGAPEDDATVWRLLGKVQILVFDFTAPGSASEALARERAARALHPDDTPRAGNLWNSLIELALRIAASGGDRTRDRLIADTDLQLFSLAGGLRFSSSRAALAEASRLALDEISDRVGGVSLTRHERVTAVHTALDTGRYLEIRGDGGVGKSGILKHLAIQVGTESQIVVLRPGRTISKGWLAMRSAIGFDGSARDLLTDLAGNGGAILFVDNLDFFSDEERSTVIDLVREAANVAGFSVIVTARRSFGVEEPNWLPADAICNLGFAEPIIIDELNEVEVEELMQASPGLAPLLANNHPARAVTRNLYRLSRLASWPTGEQMPRTEIDMASQWWQTADGKSEGRRERARLLRFLAEAALSGYEPFDVRDHPADVIAALIRTETLLDTGTDQVSFRHDVLREWAMACILNSDPEIIERLPLTRPASAALSRGVELAARMAIEHSADDTRWQLMLDRLCCGGANGSWRRAVLLSLVRSEIGIELLSRASEFLHANRAAILCELIRTVMAVDVVPATKLLARFGVDSQNIPANLDFPSNPSWFRLIRWLLSLEHNLPAAAIPDVVTLYTNWSFGMLGQDQLTPVLLKCLYSWLKEIETAKEGKVFGEWRRPFDGELDHDRIRMLETDLRTGFLAFCNRTPALAADYLQLLCKLRSYDNSVRSIMKFHGMLAQAAPAELMELTVTALMPSPPSKELSDRNDLKRPFSIIDHEFSPASPAKGPFFDLLVNAPEHGLSLIHRLIDHAISFFTGGKKYDSDAITLPFSDGKRDFPWQRSYLWSREWQAAPSCVTSALMALEAWAHRRIENDEPVDKVLVDVIGPTGSPAAYLLVAVDLLLSHWPKSREAAIPFLASPELLCVDRSRLTQDTMVVPDFFGLQALKKEPVGTVNLESLKKRVSRKLRLDQLLGQYAVYGPPDLRESIVDLLQGAAARLGPPDDASDLSDPAFMAVHALNLLDPDNWQETLVEQVDGTQRLAVQYLQPEDEKRHLDPLLEASRETLTDANMQSALGLALEDPSRSSPELAAEAAEWAQHTVSAPKQEDSDDEWLRQQAIVAAALITIRDGNKDIREQHISWARGVFLQALKSKADPVHYHRHGLRFNPIAIAFVGIVCLLKYNPSINDMRILLESAADNNPAAAHGFGAAAVTIAAIDKRLPPSLLRCAFTACIQPRYKWDLPEEKVTALSESYNQKIHASVDSELSWLNNCGPEPQWPVFPPVEVIPRYGLRVTGDRSPQKSIRKQRSQHEEYVNHQTAALWLSKSRLLFNVTERPWLRDIACAYGQWTAAINGVGLDNSEEPHHTPLEWNDAFFDMLARCIPGLSTVEVEKIALDIIKPMPEAPFFDAMTPFLQSVDVLFFDDKNLNAEMAFFIRASLADRMMASRGWRRLKGDCTDSIEWHIGPAIATLFFNKKEFSQYPSCYLTEQCIDCLDPFLPVLGKLVDSCPCILVAVVTLNLFEVSPRPNHLPFVVTAAMTWLKRFPDNTKFWADQDIGRRLCGWIEEVWRKDPAILKSNEPLRSDVDRVLAALVSLGIADARRLEEKILRDAEQ